MRNLSLEITGEDRLFTTAKRILECPFFWTNAQKSLEIVEFKEKYHAMINH